MKLSASVSVFLTFIVVFAGGRAEAYSGKDLFQLVSTPQKVSAAERSSIASVREADVAFDAGSTATLSSAIRISIPLFDGKTYAAERSSVEARAIGDLTWRGKIVAGKFEGDVVLTFKQGYVAGLIYSPNSVYEIVPKGERQVLIELDQHLFPSCAGGVTDDSPNVLRPVAAALTATDSGDRIDVLVVYTASVGTSLGGSAQAQAFAQQAVDAANTAYINSHIRQRLRLVGAQQTAMVETGSLATELPVLRTDAVTASLRDSLKADLVDMMSNSTDNCGIGYLMGSQPGNSTLGFTVTSRTCAVGNLSFAHELGHNMGSQHNPENGSGATYPYAYGHYVNGIFRTVMSYVDPCPSGCTRVAYFSNPYVNFNGLPTGIENARDNVRSINNTADAIANYRYSGSSLTLANFDAGDLIPRLIAHDLLWTSDNLTGNVRIDLSLDEGVTWKTILPNTPNDGSEPISVGGRVTRRARLRVLSLNNGSVSDSSVGNFAIR